MSGPWFVITWGSATVLMLMLWMVYRTVRRNAVLADVGFCVGFALTVLIAGWVSTGDPVKRSVIVAMGMLYALRLGGYLFWTRVRGALEDRRYQFLRAHWGGRAEGYLFLYFMVQAPAMVVLSLPLLVLMHQASPHWNGWECGGLVVWMVGFGGEAIADWQLLRFRATVGNAGNVCRDGCWRYSRHPNYFFEGMIWCGYVLMSIGVPHGWMTLIGPTLMVLSLLKVTGIPLAEAQALRSRGNAYREYQRTTNSFFPWFPKG